ncbi:chemotaxis protein CheW [Thiomicrorhabdus heinhorstiae]|uniref:chemotaxis protein CheW n=1 Tax=Thiomicrorhabdus heinhorstiae TaxID=2748010 RepID=UPI002B4B5618|nr:chemotaxis protein CheW [Thiomicrorhabdus heinhorstiae]
MFQQAYLTFGIGTELYGVNILQVQEIRSWQTPNPLPNVPAYVKGVIDLRGTVVPIMDLRERFGLAPSYDPTTVVIVVSIEFHGSSRVVGLVVDRVSDVHEFSQQAVQPPPDVSQVEQQYILGLATIEDAGNPGTANGKMVILLQLEQLVTQGLMNQVNRNLSDEPQIHEARAS